MGLQTVRLALPTPRDAFLTALAKAALAPRVIAALDKPPQGQQAPRSPVSLEGLTLGLAGSGGGSGSAAGLSPRNLGCLRALVAAVMFLAAGTLGPSWFVVLEALQNADYVLTTCGTAPPGSVVLGPSTGVPSGTPGKRSDAPAEGLAGVGQQQLQYQQQQSRQQAAHPLLGDLDPDSAQAAIQGLFYASVILEDSVFHDFIGALCKLNLEMVSIQSGTDVGSGAGAGTARE